MSKLKRVNIHDIRSWQPCYDPNRHLPEDWTGDVLDILGNKGIPFRDRLWCAFRTALVSEKLIRLYAIKAAYTVEHLMRDERSRSALRTVEAYLNGRASHDELLVARRNAYAAAYAYAADADAYAADAYAAAYAYAADADAYAADADAAAYAAYAADAAAAYAAYAAAYADAYAADADAYAAAAYAADADAYAAAYAGIQRQTHQEKQIDLLVSMIKKGVETGDSVLETEKNNE
jgi:hypothetical protein